jgi:glycosyltransferase involved in cell wall biosynthesis
MDTRELCDKLDIDPTSTVLLSPRNSKPVYCLEGVLRAFRQVLDQHPDAILIQLNEDSKANTKLKKLALELGISSQIRWLNYIPEEELALTFSLADITISLAKSDSLPTSLLEAMACGSVPIYSDVGSIGEWITPGENGMLVPPGDSQALAAAILEILAQPEEWWRQAQTRNRQIVSKRADRNRELEAVAADYSTLVDRYRGKRAVETALRDERTVV